MAGFVARMSARGHQKEGRCLQHWRLQVITPPLTRSPLTRRRKAGESFHLNILIRFVINCEITIWCVFSDGALNIHVDRVRRLLWLVFIYFFFCRCKPQKLIRLFWNNRNKPPCLLGETARQYIKPHFHALSTLFFLWTLIDTGMNQRWMETTAAAWQVASLFPGRLSVQPRW